MFQRMAVLAGTAAVREIRHADARMNLMPSTRDRFWFRGVNRSTAANDQKPEGRTEVSQRQQGSGLPHIERQLTRFLIVSVAEAAKVGFPPSLQNTCPTLSLDAAAETTGLPWRRKQ